MASTFILGEKSLSLDSVQLGRLVVNIADPQDFYYDPSPAAGLVPIVTEHRDFRGVVDSDRGNSFLLKLTRLVSLGHSKRHSLVSHVDTKCVKHYQLDNSRQYFQDIIQLMETRKWIETALKQGGQIFLLVGFMTFLDAVVTECEARFKSSDLSLSVPVTGAILGPMLGPIPGNVLDTSTEWSINRGGAIKSTFVAQGEQIFALQYRKVKISLHNSKDLESTLRGSQWKVLTKHRHALTSKTDDVLETDISESEEPDNFEFDDDDDDDDEGWTKVVDKMDEGGDFYL